MIAIVAVSPSWGIGRSGGLLYSLKEDMRFFRRTTLGKTVICGRKTLESFPGGRPLPNRRTIVISRNPFYRPEGAEVVRSPREALALTEGLPKDEVFVIGGGEIYRQMLPYCDTALVTRVDREPEEAPEIFFPDLEKEEGWTLTEASEPLTEGEFSYRFCRYEQKKAEEKEPELPQPEESK